MSNVIKLTGDLRCNALVTALIDVVYERGGDMSIASIIGCLDMAKIGILDDIAALPDK